MKDGITETAQPPAFVIPVPPQSSTNPFQRAQSEHLADGAVAIESERAIAEAQGALVVAKRFPRDPFQCFEMAREACTRPTLAAEAFYSYPRGGQTIRGPSIRLAEELARCWGNVDYGLRELSNRPGISEMEVYCHDLERNTKSKQQFTVRHLRDKKSSTELLTDQRDIYEVTANMGARRLRARIIAILPADLISMATETCEATLKAAAAKESTEPLQDRIRKLIAFAAPFGITQKLIEERLGHPIADTTPDELAELKEIFRSIKDGNTKSGEWFGAKLEAPEHEPSLADAPVKGGRGKKKPEPTPTGPQVQVTPAPTDTTKPVPEGQRVTKEEKPQEQKAAPLQQPAVETTKPPAASTTPPKAAAPAGAKDDLF